MTVIRNGTVIDGSGKSAFVGDIRIEGDRIVEVIDRADGEAPQSEIEIDATDRLVTPGFIDAHAHSDAYLVIEPSAPSKISQGITTEINGQCGGSVAPRYGEARLSGDWAAILGERLTWRSLGEYREVLAQARPAINTVQFVGHNTLRSSIVGYAGRPATSDEQHQMERLLEQSLDEGGWGLTTGLIYQPGKYSTPEEVVALARVAAAKGGYYATHMRSEGDRISEAIDEVLELVKATGIRAEISHLKTSGRDNWTKIDRVLEKIDGAVECGELLGSDRYPYCAAGTDLDVVFPDWAGEGGIPAEMARLDDPGLRRKIVDEINACGRDWSTVMIGGTWHPENKRYSGCLVSKLLEANGMSAGEFICDLLAKDGCKTGAFFFGMSEDNLRKIYAMPWIVPGSDASLRAPWGPLGADHPHPRAYGTMPEFYRRLRELGESREATVRRMTAVPAQRFGIRQRGEIKKGNFADIAIWRERDFQSAATYAEPHRFATGMEVVMVNGVVGYDHGRFSETRGGRFLER